MNRIEFLQTLIGLIGIEAALPAGAAPWELPAGGGGWLESWLRLPLVPLREPRNAREVALLAAMRGGGTISFRYFGGSEPGRMRRVAPVMLFTKLRPEELARAAGDPGEWLESLLSDPHRRGPGYLSAWCGRRGAARCFRIDRMEWIEGVACPR